MTRGRDMCPRERKIYYIEAEPEGKLNLVKFLWGKNLRTL